MKLSGVPIELVSLSFMLVGRDFINIHPKYYLNDASFLALIYFSNIYNLIWSIKLSYASMNISICKNKLMKSCILVENKNICEQYKGFF
jgi:hypothetical protein